MFCLRAINKQMICNVNDIDIKFGFEIGSHFHHASMKTSSPHRMLKYKHGCHILVM